MNVKKNLVCAICALALAVCALPAGAELRLPPMFADHMVLQRDVAVPVWGWAEPGEEVTVEFAGQKKTTKADAKGQWTVKLDPMPLSAEPRALRVFSTLNPQPLTISDILVGEVWLGSGQSNMAMSVERAKDFDKEKAASNLPQVRMFTVTSGAAATAQDNCTGSWAVCAPDTVGKFSATLFFFGRELHRKLGVPIGLINSSVGGTPIESWISPEAQQQCEPLKEFFAAVKKSDAEFDPAKAKAAYEKQLARWKEAAARAKAAGKKPGRAPRDPLAVRSRKGNVGGLFNGKIAPLIPYAMRGTVWYQGEANTVATKAPFYQHQLPLLVQDWRTRWGCEFPFAWVQLPNYDGGDRNLPLVREAMLKSLKEPKTGMAITIDIGEARNIHPKNKQDVGKRLSLWALATVYGKKVAASGPLPAGHKISGDDVVITFKHTDGGLTAKGGELKGFTIAGADKKWIKASAKIASDTVVVSSPDVREPVAVRYAWENNPGCNLYNGAGLPASPFRTDDWQ